MPMIVPVILCGGAGKRLWPESRDDCPKQFLSVDGQRSIFRATLERVMRLKSSPRPVIITNEVLRFLVLEELEQTGAKGDIVLEAIRRDTGPAIGAAAVLIASRTPDAVIAVFPSDHHVGDDAAFEGAVKTAAAVAAGGHLVTFGLKPAEPSSAYGYIEPGLPLDGYPDVRRVARFVEKPDAATAAHYLAQGFLWNSGMFVARADAILAELARSEPAMASAVDSAVRNATQDGPFTRLESSAFGRAPAKAFDYAVMEKTEQAAVLPVELRWSDIGSWDALWAVSDRDPFGNAVRGNVVLGDTEGSIVRSEKALTAVLGMKNVIVIATEDAVLVAPKERAQDVKGIVEQLEAEKRSEVSEHRRVLRPWGAYESKDAGDRYQVKHITVKPGGRLSLQKHYHRSEHWIVVRGTAQVTVNGEVRLLHENESTYIPAGAVHRLENPGLIPLELIEVQVGSYLGEDDIVRLSDDYGRGEPSP